MPILFSQSTLCFTCAFSVLHWSNWMVLGSYPRCQQSWEYIWRWCNVPTWTSKHCVSWKIFMIHMLTVVRVWLLLCFAQGASVNQCKHEWQPIICLFICHIILTVRSSTKCPVECNRWWHLWPVEHEWNSCLQHSLITDGMITRSGLNVSFSEVDWLLLEKMGFFWKYKSAFCISISGCDHVQYPSYQIMACTHSSRWSSTAVACPLSSSFHPSKHMW